MNGLFAFIKEEAWKKSGLKGPVPTQPYRIHLAPSFGPYSDHVSLEWPFYWWHESEVDVDACSDLNKDLIFLQGNYSKLMARLSKDELILEINKMTANNRYYISKYEDNFNLWIL